MAKRQANGVVDEVPPGAVDVGEPAPSGTEVSIFASAPVWQPHPKLVEIAKLHEEALALLGSSDLSTEAGYKAVKAYKVGIMRKRTAVDARRLDEGRQARDYIAAVNSAGNTVINKLKEIEEPLEAALKAQDDKSTAEALARAQAIEAEQRRKEDERLALLAAEAKRVKDAEEAELAKRRADIEAERKKLDEQQAEYNRQRAELLKQQEELRAENERLQREAREKIEAENRRVELVKQEERRKEEEKEKAARDARQAEERAAQAEQERIATEARVKREREEAAALAVKNEQARVAREAEALRIKEEKERQAAIKKAARASDIEKLARFRKYLDEAVDNLPLCKDEHAVRLVKQIKDSVTAQLISIKQYLEAK